MARTDEDVRLLKIVWAQMIEKGKPILNPEKHSDDYYWDQHAADFVLSKEFANPRKPDGFWQMFIRNMIHTPGVDWDETTVPEMKTYAEFMDTDCGSDYKDGWTGKLLFNNGKEIWFGATDIDIKPECEKITAESREHDMDMAVKRIFG